MKSKSKIPMRQCTGCKEMKNKKELMRVLLTPQGTIEIDLTGRKNGRGAYLCRSRECLEKSIRSHGIERSLKMAIPAEVYEKLKEEFTSIE